MLSKDQVFVGELFLLFQTPRDIEESRVADNTPGLLHKIAKCRRILSKRDEPICCGGRRLRNPKWTLKACLRNSVPSTSAAHLLLTFTRKHRQYALCGWVRHDVAPVGECHHLSARQSPSPASLHVRREDVLDRWQVPVDGHGGPSGRADVGSGGGSGYVPCGLVEGNGGRAHAQEDSWLGC